jgi:hypothetical protein
MVGSEGGLWVETTSALSARPSWLVLPGVYVPILHFTLDSLLTVC